MQPFGDAALVFLSGAGVCLFLGRFAIRGLTRAQCVAPVRYEDCPPLLAYQETKQQIPTMGGLFMLAAAILVAAGSGGLAHPDGWLVLGGVTGLGGLGLWDDYLKFRNPNAVGLRSLPKLLVTLAVGAGIGWAIWTRPDSGRVLAVPWLGQGVTLDWGWIPFSMLVVASCAHAVNLTDGMDGLAAGCVAIALMALGCWALMGHAQNRVVLPWCAALAGACVGFLWFNSFPASVYMGDVGSLGLGAALAVLSLLTHAALWLLVIGGVFVIEALSVILQVVSYKWRGKRRIFRVAPLHHHFHLGGMSEPKVTVRFWIVGLLLAMLGLAGFDQL